MDANFKKAVQVDLHLEEKYTESRIRQALENINRVFGEIKYVFPGTEKDVEKKLIWKEYEDIDFELVMEMSVNGKSRAFPMLSQVMANSFVIRKGLIRKGHLAFYVKKFVSKRPNSILSRTFPETYLFEFIDPEYFDEAMMEVFEVEGYLQENQELPPSQRHRFILKSSILDKASEIFLFDSRDQLQEFFERRFHESDEGDLQFIREWIIQRYITRPLLVKNRKFHLRTYVVACGNLKVFVYRRMLALFAQTDYDCESPDLSAHITNTCFQSAFSNVDESSLVEEFWNLPISSARLDGIYGQILEISGEIFRALVHEASVFQAVPNSFEIFGFDFLVEDSDRVYFLEANAFPDFKQTGIRLSGLISSLFQQIANLLIHPTFFPQDTWSTFVQSPDLHLVLDSRLP